MDNDNKINMRDEDEKKVVRLFLQDELQPLSQEKPHSYNLETEYAKTKKNKSPFIWILMILCFVLAGLFAFAMSRYVDYTNNNISINIDSFDDLNLKNLLDIVSQTKSQYDTAVNDKSELEANLNNSLQQAERKRDADLFTLQSLKLSSKENLKRKNIINTEYKTTVQDLHDKYDVQISTKQGLIDQYQKQLAEYDSSKVEQAKQQEAAIDSERQLNELEKKKLSEKYEMQMNNMRNELSSSQKGALESQKKAVGEVSRKYQAEIDSLDPVVKDSKGIVRKSNQNQMPPAFNTEDQLNGISSDASFEFRNAVKDVESIYSDFDEAEKVVSSLPQKNSIPSFVKAMKSYAYKAGFELTKASVSEVNRFAAQTESYKKEVAAKEKEKQAVLDQMESYQKYFENMCSDNSWDGMLISLSSTIDLPVYISKGKRVYFTDEAYKDVTINANLMRKNSIVTPVTLKEKNGAFYCTPKDVSKSSRVRVGDYIEIEPPVLETAPDK